MTKYTHILVATVLSSKLILANPITILGLVGSVVPDFDLKFGIKHRTITHSLLICGFTSLAILSFNYKIGTVYTISYISHLVLDSFTKTGVPLLYPFSTRYHGIKKVRTGDIFDISLSALSLIFLYYLFL